MRMSFRSIGIAGRFERIRVRNGHFFPAGAGRRAAAAAE